MPEPEDLLQPVLDMFSLVLPGNIHLLPLLFIHIRPNLDQLRLFSPQEALWVGRVEEVHLQEGPDWRLYPSLCHLAPRSQGDLRHDQVVDKTTEQEEHQYPANDQEDSEQKYQA